MRRAGAEGEITLRVDSGFWSNATIVTLGRLGVRYTMTVRTGTTAISVAIAAIAEADWVDIDYPEGGAAQAAQTEYAGRRLIVRRTRLTDRSQARLWPDWRHHAFLTDLDGDAVEIDAFHRDHARVELAIRDAKEGAGLEHMPSGVFAATGAWLACVVLAHNLIRWTALAGGVNEDRLVVARTLRTRLVSVPARLVNRAGTLILRLPEHWPWAESFCKALDRLRAVPDYAPG